MMTAIYLIPYHSEPGLYLRGSSGQFAIIEKAIVAREWPYDNGDDPSFYVARKGGPLTWGVCRQDVRNTIERGSIVVFFSYTSSGRQISYRLSAVATVAGTLDRRDVFSDARHREHLVACRRESVTAVGTPQNQKRGHALRVPAIGAALSESLTNELTATGH